MKIGDFISGKKELARHFSQSQGLELYFGFGVNMIEESNLNSLNQGWWHILFFAENKIKGVQFGLRIYPNLPLAQWPVVSLGVGPVAVTFSPDITSFFKVVVAETTIESADYFDAVKQDWNLLTQVAELPIQYFNWQDSLNWLSNYVTNSESNRPVSEKHWASEQWSKVLYELDETKNYKFLKELIHSMMSDENKIPSVSLTEFGIWKTWAANLLAARMVIKANHYSFEQVARVMWEGFRQPTGYDPADIYFSYLPERVYDPYMGAFEIANVLNASYFEVPSDIQADPLFPAVGAIMKNGKSGYQGQEHMEAAKNYKVLGRTEDAWNALVSAAYWSGKNSDQSDLSALDAAINLVEPASDAHQALIHNFNLIKNNL